MAVDLFRVLIIVRLVIVLAALVWEGVVLRAAIRDVQLLRASGINGTSRMTAGTNLRNELRRTAAHLLFLVIAVDAFIAVPDPTWITVIGSFTVIAVQVLITVNSLAAKRLRERVVAYDLAHSEGGAA